MRDKKVNLVNSTRHQPHRRECTTEGHSSVHYGALYTIKYLHEIETIGKNPSAYEYSAQMGYNHEKRWSKNS